MGAEGMRVGFTGTREELACEQHAALCSCIRLARDSQGVTEFHHGCCIGADAEGMEAVGSLCPGTRIVAHPPDRKTMLSHLALDMSHEKRSPLPYLDRNRAIVDATELLIACPKGPEEQRSGTWSTVRYARTLGRKIVIVWPDGTVTADGEGTR